MYTHLGDDNGCSCPQGPCDPPGCWARDLVGRELAEQPSGHRPIALTPADRRPGDQQGGRAPEGPGHRVRPVRQGVARDGGLRPRHGRPALRRPIQREIEDSLSEKILFGELCLQHIVVVDTDGEGDTKTFAFQGEEKSALPDVPPIDQAAGGERPTSGTEF